MKGECMMIIRKEISPDTPLTEEQKKMLEALRDIPAEPDDDCPELTTEQLAKMRRISEIRRGERRK